MSGPILAVAFPKREADRARLRVLMEGTGAQIPALYPHGIERPCMDCAMVLDVGPRVVAQLHEHQDTARLYCPICVAKYLVEDASPLTMVNLGNPDSRPEEP